MNTWWCAIDRQWSSYSELKQRAVVAQGWPGLGDLRSLLKFVPHDTEPFKATIRSLGDRGYGWLPLWNEKDRESRRAPAVFWNLLNLERGDVIVGLEGATVRGVCQLPWAARWGYRYDDRFHYAQAVGPVEWLDWDETRFGFTPTAPAQSVHGIKRLSGERQKVLDVWMERGNPATLSTQYWVDADVPTSACVLHTEDCELAKGDLRTGLKGVGELFRDGGWFLCGSLDTAKDLVDRIAKPLCIRAMTKCERCH